MVKREVKKKREKVSEREGERNKVKEIKKEPSFLKRFFRTFGLIFVSFCFYVYATGMLVAGKWIFGIILFLVGLTANVYIFIKGRKAAIIFTSLFLGVTIIMMGFLIVRSLGISVPTSEEDKLFILQNESENIENFFDGLEDRNYTAFSRDLNEDMKIQYDNLTFFSIHDELGEFFSRNCSDAAKSNIGDKIVYCDIEAENARTYWGVYFNKNDKIRYFGFVEMPPNVTIEIQSKEVVKSINIIDENGKRTEMSSAEDAVYLVFDVSIKNNKDAETRVHEFKFLTNKYLYSLISDENTPTDCNLIREGVFKANETKQGCLIFYVGEIYTEGTISVI